MEPVSINLVRKTYQVLPNSRTQKPKGSHGDEVVPCIHCGQAATKEIHFKSGRAIIVERYCDSCVEPKRFSLIQNFYNTCRWKEPP